MRVLHVVLKLDCGGLERIVLDLIRHGQKLGQDVSVLCLQRPGLFAPDAEALGARVFCLHKPPGVRLGLIADVRRLLRRVRPHVVHTHQIGALFYAGPASRGGGAGAVVHTEHGKHYQNGRESRWLGRIAAPFASRFLCVSRDIADEVLSYGIVPRHKVRVVSNGVDTAYFSRAGSPEAVRKALGIPPDAPVVGTVGRIVEAKSQDLLVRAFAALFRRPDAHLLIVGDGPNLPRLRELTSSLDVDRNAHLVGYQADPHSYLRAMNVFAQTSAFEGMPLAVLEASAAGVPVIATRVGGVPEMIEDGVTGLLFEPGDLPALTRQLERLLSDPAAARHIGDAGRTRVRTHHDVTIMAAAYARHYRELLGQREREYACPNRS